MPDRTTTTPIDALKRAACVLAVSGALVAGPVAAQTSPAEGAPPPDNKAADTLKRMEANQASRMRDLLTMLALVASKEVAMSIGAIDASADGGALRIENVVIVDRKAMTVQFVPLTTILDLDRRHAVSRHFRLITYTDVVIGTLPPMVQPMIQAMGIDSLAGRMAVEFKFDEAAGILDIRGVSMEWGGVARLVFILRLVNVPPLNDMILLAAQKRIAPRAGEIRLKSASLVLRSRSLNRVLETVAGMFGGRNGGGSPLVGQLEQLKQRAKNEIQRRLVDALMPAAKGPAIVTVALSSPTGVPLIEIERMRSPMQIENLFTLEIEGRAVPADEALRASLPPESRDTALDKTASNPPSHACDEVGALPNDPDKAGAGVPDNRLNVSQALADCLRATVEYPAAARFHLQFGRALWLAGHKPIAVAELKKAVELGSETAKTHPGLQGSK